MNRYGTYLIVSLVIIAPAVWLGCGSRAYQGGSGSERNAGPQLLETGVQFSIYEPNAKKVHVVGDFNNWSTTADPLYDQDGDGLWSVVMPLTPGRYEYKFLLDGEKWVPDPGNQQRTPDGFDGFNSILVVE